MGIDLTAAIKNARSGSYASADNKESGALAESPRCAPRKHSHYFKDVSGLGTVDVYRVLLLFGVADPCLQHAIKKLLVAGGRGGGKDISRDVREARETLERWEEMRREEQAGVESQAASEQIASLIEKGAATQAQSLRPLSEEPNPRLSGDGAAEVEGILYHRCSRSTPTWQGAKRCTLIEGHTGDCR